MTILCISAAHVEYEVHAGTSPRGSHARASGYIHVHDALAHLQPVGCGRLWVIIIISSIAAVAAARATAAGGKQPRSRGLCR